MDTKTYHSICRKIFLHKSILFVSIFFSLVLCVIIAKMNISLSQMREDIAFLKASVITNDSTLNNHIIEQIKKEGKK